jgi:hypothetical protein
MFLANSPASPSAYGLVESELSLTLSCALAGLPESPTFFCMITTGPLRETDTVRGRTSASWAQGSETPPCHKISSLWQGLVLGTDTQRLYTVGIVFRRG